MDMPDYNVVIKGRLRAADEQDLDVQVDDLIESLGEEFDNTDIEVEYTDDDDNDEVAQFTFVLEDTEVTVATDQA
jgi:hypothetical protein